jgi:prepilin-type N-terminal cleavage/methylation domain-containing protein
MISNRFLGFGWKQKGFTLIELLIVIAIILILISIALPNFLEAQLRAKVTRVKAELKTLETVHAMYYQDFTSYPFNHRATEGAAGSDGDTGMPTTDCNKRTGVFNQSPYWSYEAVAYLLTTPIKYMSNAELKDQFQLSGNPNAGGAAYLYHYTSSKIAHCRGWGNGLAYKYTRSYTTLGYGPVRLKYPNTAYVLWSIGPDTKDGYAQELPMYSPTNGSNSGGDIVLFVP